MCGTQLRNSNQMKNDLCGLHSYSVILRENGVDLDDRDLFSLLKLYDFRCYFLENGIQTCRISHATDAFCITGIAPFDEKRINSLSKVCFSKNCCLDDSEAVNIIRDNVRKGHKVIVFADVFYLRYHPLFHRYHTQTQLLICDENESGIYIADYHLPTSPITVFKGWITKKEFLQALLIGRNNEQAETPGIITYSINDEIKDDPEDIRRAVLENFDSVLCENFNDSFRIGERINRSICEMRGKGNFQKLAISAYAHITGRAGMVLSRKVMSEILDNLGYEANEFERIADNWQGIAGAFFRLSLRWNPDRVNMLCKKIYDVIDLEYKEIKKCIKRLTY